MGQWRAHLWDLRNPARLPKLGVPPGQGTLEHWAGIDPGFASPQVLRSFRQSPEDEAKDLLHLYKLARLSRNGGMHRRRSYRLALVENCLQRGIPHQCQYLPLQGPAKPISHQIQNRYRPTIPSARHLDLLTILLGQVKSKGSSNWIVSISGWSRSCDTT